MQGKVNVVHTQEEAHAMMLNALFSSGVATARNRKKHYSVRVKKFGVKCEVNVDLESRKGKCFKISLCKLTLGVLKPQQVKRLINASTSFPNCNLELGSQGKNLSDRGGVVYKLDTGVVWETATTTDFIAVADAAKRFAAIVLGIV